MDSAYKAVAKYRKAIKRVELALYPEEYEKVKAAADAAGDSVSSYIKQAALKACQECGQVHDLENT